MRLAYSSEPEHSENAGSSPADQPPSPPWPYRRQSALQNDLH